MDIPRVSDGGRRDNVLEVNLETVPLLGGKLTIEDLGLTPRVEPRTSWLGVYSVLSKFYDRIKSSGKSRFYLVPMSPLEYTSYKNWKDSQDKSPSSTP